MKARLSKAMTLIAALGCAFALTACDRSHKCEDYANMSVGGGYLCLGHLNYQVQISRQLNPYDVEDRAYLTGLSSSAATLAPGQAWFAVFVQVTNYSGHLVQAANLQDFYITDTQGNIYRPYAGNAQQNPYLYQGGVLGGGGTPHGAIIPAPDTAAADGPVDGAVLLFKVQISSYDNRPLTLYIQNPSQPSQSVRADLDV